MPLVSHTRTMPPMWLAPWPPSVQWSPARPAPCSTAAAAAAAGRAAVRGRGHGVAPRRRRLHARRRPLAPLQQVVAVVAVVALPRERVPLLVGGDPLVASRDARRRRRGRRARAGWRGRARARRRLLLVDGLDGGQARHEGRRQARGVGGPHDLLGQLRARLRTGGGGEGQGGRDRAAGQSGSLGQA